ncbi:ergosterol biosynthesis protein-like protein Erg28 [Mycena sanguinolenta]|nr:ergosterol biosynthesis protein-like protein Erg28 [Mycena sanguinolenta]
MALPQSDGWLPYFLLYAASVAISHSAACYISPALGLKTFRGPNRQPPNRLLAHVYALMNVYTTAIRVYTAYHIDNAQLYNLATLSFVGVLSLYVSEMYVYGTVRMREAWIPFATAGTGLAWMLVHRSWYLGA